MSTIRALFTPPDASSPLSSLSAHMAAYDALCRGAPRDSVMREFFTFPGVCAAVLTHLDEQERRKLVTLNDDAFMVVIAEVYEKVKAAQYEHLVERMTPTARLQQYIAHTRHLDVRGGPALRLLPGCTDIYDYFVHFPKLERLETDDRTIVRRFVSIPSQCLEYWPRRASHYGISHTLHIRLCDIWDLGDHEAIPLEWQANSHLPLADTEFATYKLQQHLEIEFSWSEPVPDTTERRALWRDRLISILRGRCITSITIKGAQPFMLDRISAILADVQADDATHLSLESVIVKLEKWLPFNELISRHAIQAFATCAPELKIVMQGRPDDGVKGYENILTMLPFAGWITHLAFEHPFHLFGSPSMTYVVNGVNPADTDFPIDDVQWPELGNNTTRKQLSALSTIKTISFCARARGQMYYDRLDKAKAKQAAKEAARVAAEEEEAERARQAELVARELEHGPYVDPWPTSDFIDVFTCTTAVAATVQTQQTAGKSDCRSRASSCASTAGPSKGSSSSSSSSFTSASSPLNKIATALETPDEEAAREAKEKEEAELRNVSWNTRMLSCLIAVLGHKEVKLAVESIIPDEKDVSAEIIVPEHPLEDWFVDSAGEKAPEVGREFIAQCVKDGLKGARAHVDLLW